VSLGFSPQKEIAVVACGNNFPDALAASSLAGVYNAPVILTDSSTLSPQASSQLSRLGVKTVHIMGGAGAISPAVESAIANMGITINRISGTDRLSTSVATLRAANAAGNASNTVIIATGYNYADSLSIGPWAYYSRSPIILTQPDGTLSYEAVNAIKSDPTKSNIIIVGGTAVVSDYVKDQLGDIYNYTRLSGINRYETSRRIAEWEVTHGLSWNVPLMATGNNYPDALAGAAVAGNTHSPLLLVANATDTTVDALRANRTAISNYYILGGESAVSSSLANTIASTLNK
jgi:putative cell wall-binding protein